VSDPQLHANGHIPVNPVIGGRSGHVHRNGMLIGLPTLGTLPPVGAEHSCTVDLQISTFQSYNRYTGQLALAARRGVDCLQDRRTHIQVLHGIALECLMLFSPSLRNCQAQHVIKRGDMQCSFCVFNVAIVQNIKIIDMIV